MSNTIYRFIEKKKPKVIITENDDNLLLNVIDMVCLNGDGYNHDGVESFADNNGTVFEKEMEGCLDHFKFDRIQVTETEKNTANRIDDCIW